MKANDTIRRSRVSCTRRQVLGTGVWISGGAVLVALGCAQETRCPAANPGAAQPSARPRAPASALAPARDGTRALGKADLQLLRAPGGPLPLVTRQPNDTGLLRRLARPWAVSDAPDRTLLERRMRDTLQATQGGVGLAAPQVGIGVRVVLVMLGARSDSARVQLFVNPRIVQRSDDVTVDYEGCLSIPGVCGLVRRNREIVVEHESAEGAIERLQVADFDARIFQHEIDHLDGVLYVDRVEGGIQPRDRLKELREKLRQKEPKQACTPEVFGRHRDEVML